MIISININFFDIYCNYLKLIYLQQQNYLMSLKYSNTKKISPIIYLNRLILANLVLSRYYDFKILYSRTYLGSLYSILSKLISITAISLLWSYILKQEFSDFFPYLLFGMLIWFYITDGHSKTLYIL